MTAELEKEALRVLLRTAGAKLLEYWPGNAKNTLELGAVSKSDGSLVSRADFASNELLVSGLNKIFPDDGLHSEEVPVTPDTFRKERVWIIDPLDGTGVFLRGSDEFCILVALTVSAEPECGFMYFPARDLLLEAEAGRGATINGKKLSVSPASTLGPEKVYVRSLGLSKPEIAYPGRLDSGHAFLKVACGELDALAFRLDKLKEWDLAAPAIVLEEAGGIVSDGSAQRLRYRPGELPPVFVGSNGKCHQELLESLFI